MLCRKGGIIMNPTTQSPKKFLEFVPQTDDIDLTRIERLHRKMQNRQASICSERALLYTASFQKTQGEEYILRKAKAFAHTLNNTVVAPPRMLIAFLENNLQADGSVRIPEPLRMYMGGKEFLSK